MTRQNDSRFSRYAARRYAARLAPVPCGTSQSSTAGHWIHHIRNAIVVVREHFNDQWIHPMKTLQLCVVLLAATLPNTLLQAEDGPAKERLFDGRTFDGWQGDVGKTWRIENGTLTAGSHDAEAPRNEFLSTTAIYKNFDLSVKFKVIGDHKINAGIQFRTKRIPDHHEVSGFQADISPTYDGHLYDESRRRKFLAEPDEATRKKAQAAVAEDGWNIYRIRAEGNRIQLWFNGVPTVDYTETDEKIELSGIVAIQIHGGMKGTISYKDLIIYRLPD